MGQLLIKQKVFSWTDTYDVYDQSGNPKYYVKADFFSLGHRIHVFDKMTGREVGLIQEKILRIFKEFEVIINGFSQGIIKKQLFRWGDTYVLDIANDADELPALMVAIAMDAARCSDDDSRKPN